MKINLEKFRGSVVIKILILFVTTLLISLMFPRGESLESEVSVGSIWIKDDLIAPFSFPILKSEEVYKKELEDAKNRVYPIFVRDDNQSKKSIDSLLKYNKYLVAIIDSDLTKTNPKFENPTFLSSESYETFKQLRLKEKSFSKKNNNFDKLISLTENTIKEIYKIGIINLEYDLIVKDSIAIRKNNIDEIAPNEKFYDRKTVNKVIDNYLALSNINENEKKTLSEYINHFIVPNIIYSEDLTKEEIEIAQSKVSKYSGIVNENERIVAKHDRITPDIKQKIDSFKIAKGNIIGIGGIILQGFGKFLHIVALLVLLSVYVYLFRKKIFYDNVKILLVAILLLGISLLTFLINQLDVTDSIKLLIFIPTTSMLITIIFDSRLGFYTTVVFSLIAGALRGNDYTFVAMNIVAGVLSVYTVRDIKNRTQIFRSFLFILIGYAGTILAFGLERFDSIEKILIELSFAGTNALISPILTYGLLIFFEHIFKITTDLSLLELSNFERPLLRELARKAPGSFNHSLVMGTIAESASEAIGANSLLARVGAYYHDIGKIIAPNFFVENQLDNKNIHENLKPEESVKIIIEHVTKGIELAKSYKLPKEIIDFIPMHHGTLILTFFYEKAKELFGEDKINIDDYRYPGPKPQTKETAIVMLADCCESAVRSIENPDLEKIENLINNLINNRIEDGQLDEAPITFKDITQIKNSFVNILLGHHHRRIRYPKQEEMEKEIEK